MVAGLRGGGGGRGGGEGKGSSRARTNGANRGCADRGGLPIFMAKESGQRVAKVVFNLHATRLGRCLCAIVTSSVCLPWAKEWVRGLREDLDN
jgi:hypothetical protein